MTDLELARAIRERHCAADRAAKGRRVGIQSWEKLTGLTKEQLLEEARILREEYATGGDPPSRGLK